MAERRVGLLAEILGAYADLRGSIAAKLAQGPRDSQLLMLTFVAAAVGFVAGLPAAREQALELAEPEAMTGVLAGRLFAAVFITPLALFALAALSHLVAKPFGGTGSFWAARVALVWAVVVALPLLVASAALSPFLGLVPAPAGPALSAFVSAGATLGFVWIWAVFLTEAEGFRTPALVLVSILGILAAVALLPSLA